MLHVDIESVDDVACGVGGKFYGGSWSVCFLCSACLSLKPSITPFLSSGKVLFQIGDGGEGGRDCSSVPVRVEQWTALCDSWRQCCQATDFAGVVW